MIAKDYIKSRQAVGSASERRMADMAFHLLIHLEAEAENQRRIFGHSESEILRQAIRIINQMAPGKTCKHSSVMGKRQ